MQNFIQGHKPYLDHKLVFCRRTEWQVSNADEKLNPVKGRVWAQK